jgi:hypothetical protein
MASPCAGARIPPYLPPYARFAGEAKAHSGSVPAAFAATFRRAGVPVHATGDDRWRHLSPGLLLVGDHRCRHEFIALCALLGEAGRPGATLLAKPYSRTARMLQAVAPDEPDVVLPLVPRTLARDRAGVWNRDLLTRLRYGDRLPTAAELAAMNERSIVRAGRLLAAGRAVVIFPAGVVGDALRAPWHRGVGRIVRAVHPAARDNVLVVLFRCERFSPRRLIAALNKPGTVRAPAVHVRMHTWGPASDLPDAGRLRERFREVFS